MPEGRQAQSAGEWLESALLGLCSNLDSGLQLDPEVVRALVSYCELAPPDDAKEYLINIIGDERCKDIVNGYLQRRQFLEPVNVVDRNTGEILQAYVKPRTEDTWAIGGKKASKSTNAKHDITIQTINHERKHNTATKSGNERKDNAATKSGKAMKSKGKQGMSITEANAKSLIKQGKPCSCQATRHRLVSNCLSCGKIVCEQEGEGPCSFCGALVLREGSSYAGLDRNGEFASESEAAAHEFKERLVEYDRNSASRTTVIDDQSDYFELEGNAWLSEEEKKLLQKRQEELKLAEEKRRKKIIVTLDLLGRKVLLDDPGKDTDGLIGESMLISSKPLTHDSRIKPNPYITEPPVYIDVGVERHGTTSTGLLRTGRVQHDDPVVEALNALQLGNMEGDNSKPIWRAPKLRRDLQCMENFECEEG